MIMVEDSGRSNWIWLSDIAASGRVLDLSGTSGAAAMGLAHHFDEVHCVCDTVDACVVARRRWTARSAGKLAVVCCSHAVVPYAPSTFDCVVLHGPLGPSAATLQKVGVAATLLRKGGCLQLITAGTRLRPLLRSTSHAVAAHRFRRRLRALGFRSIASYWAASLEGEIRDFVPMNRRAFYGVQSLVQGENAGLRLHLSATLAHVHGLLWGAQLHLGYK